MDPLRISVTQRRFEPIRATRMQRPRSTAMLTHHATARQDIDCIRIGCGFDPHYCDTEQHLTAIGD